MQYLFSTETLPYGVRELLGLLPLSATSRMVRSIAYGEAWNPAGIIVLLAYLAVLILIGMWFVYRKQNL